MRKIHFKALSMLLFLLAISCNLSIAQEKLRIINYNVLVGMETDTTSNKESFANWIKSQNPDILALEEMNNFTPKKIEEFASQYGHPYAVLLKEDGYPVALTSKFPIINVSKVLDNMHHGFIKARIKDINIIVLHLSPHKYQKRNEEIDLILETITSYPSNEKWIIMGDFNSVTPLDKEHYSNGELAKSMEGNDIEYSYVKNLVNGKTLDYDVHQKILDFGFVDVLRVFHKDFISTCDTKIFNPNEAEDTKSRIDFIYISKNMETDAITSEVLKDSFTDYSSDHYPVLFELKSREGR